MDNPFDYLEKYPGWDDIRAGAYINTDGIQVVWVRDGASRDLIQLATAGLLCLEAAGPFARESNKIDLHLAEYRICARTDAREVRAALVFIRGAPVLKSVNRVMRLFLKAVP